MRIAFMGTPDFAVPTLDALEAAGHDIAAVYTQPPRPAGRGKALQPTPIQARAEAMGLEVRHPHTLRDPQAQAEFAALDLDVAVVAAYGLILPQAILGAPRHGCLNVHASLLPRWRGAAPIHRAILEGDPATGVTIMQMEKGLDTGPMLRKEATAIGHYDTTGMLTDRLAAIGARLIVNVLRDPGPYPSTPQPEDGISYAHKIDKAEARIDWTKDAAQVDRQIRAFNPTPAAWFEVNGERIRILTANILTSDTLGQIADFPAEPGHVIGDQLAIGCSTGAIRPAMVQRAGRGVMTVQDLLRGFPIPPGTRLA